MKVYVVIRTIAYEGSDIEVVCSTKEIAEERLNSLKEYYQRDSGYMSFSYEEHELDDVIKT